MTNFLSKATDIFKKRQTLFIKIIALIFVVAIAALFFYYQKPSYVPVAFAQDNFTLEPTNKDSTGISADTAFVLTSKQSLDENIIRNQLEIQPKADYKLKKLSDTKWQISLANALPQNEVVAVKMNSFTTSDDGQMFPRPYSWAYQVHGAFRVTGTLPSDKSSRVPLDTGIEISFSYENVNDIAGKVRISPAVLGRWEAHRKTWVFIPKELKPSTIYTVYVPHDLGLTGSSATLGKDYSFQFETGSTKRNVDFYLGSRFLIFSPDEAPSISYGSYGETAGRTVQAELYQFGSDVDFMIALKVSQELNWTSEAMAESAFDLKLLPKVASFAPLEKTENYFTTLEFPEKLASGYYLAVINYGDISRWTLIESSSLAMYATKGINETLVWVVQSGSAIPVSGANVFDASASASAVTDMQGLARLPANTQSTFFTVSYKERNLIFPADLNEWNTRRLDNIKRSEWWNYLYSDRPIYQPTDTVSFWGYAERRGDGKKPKEVTVKLTQNYGWDYFSNKSDIENFGQTTAPVTSRGTFTGKVSYDGLLPGWYSLSVYVDDFQISSRSIQVFPYVKPAYSITVVPSVDAVFAGTSVDWKINAAFFDGTPVKGLMLKVIDTDGGSHDGITDDRGNYLLALAPNYNPPVKANIWAYDGYPRSWGITVSPVRPEEGEIQTYAQVEVFGPNIKTKTMAEVSGNEGIVKVFTRKVEPVASYWIDDYAPNTAPNVPVRFEATKITWKKIEMEQSYDFINKVAYKNYRYEQTETKVGEISVISDNDGLATYRFPYAEDEASTYRVRVIATGSNGREAVETVSVYKRQYDFYGSNPNHFSLNDPENGKQRHIGDVVNLFLDGPDGPIARDPQRVYFYYQTHLGVINPSVSDDPIYRFTFKEENIPNVGVKAVSWNGYAFQTASNSINYDQHDSALKVTVNTDKPTYRPGENVTLSVHTVRSSNNLPVSAEVNLNLVDEAIYAIANETVDPLGNLFGGVDSGELWSDWSHRAGNGYGFEGGAEKGGGGGDGGRTNFRDLALFETLVTDFTGNGQVTFKLPDNITSWRVTTQAILTDEKRAGSVVGKIPVSLPFFIQPVLKNEYRAGDEPQVLLSSYGTGIDANASVNYTAAIKETGWTGKVSAPASAEAVIALPALARGNYQLKIQGSSGELQDTLTREIKIVDSFLRLPKVVTEEVQNGKAPTGADIGSTYLTFTDAAIGAYYNELVSMAGVYGDRLDERIVRLVAPKIIKEVFGDENFIPETFATDLYAPGDGSLRLLPYSYPDIALTAKIAAISGQPYDLQHMARYFERVLGKRKISDLTPLASANEAAAAYFGLAATGEPVLLEVQAMAARTDLDSESRLYLALALDELGDKEGARAIYRNVITENGKNDLGVIWIDSDTVEAKAEQTALAAILAGSLGEPQYNGLRNYLFSQNRGETLLVLEELLDIQKSLANLPLSESVLSYTLSGKTEQVALKKGSAMILHLGQSDLAALNPQVLKGKVQVTSYSETALVDASKVGDARLKLTREYKQISGKTTSQFNRGDIVRVEIKFGLPELNETYTVTDILPAGLSLLTQPYAALNAAGIYPPNSCSYPLYNASQRVYFSLYSGYTKDCGSHIVYYARVVTPGTYTIEPVYIRSTRDTKIFNFSPPASEVLNIK